MRRSVLLIAAVALCAAPTASQTRQEDPRRVVKIIKVDRQAPPASGIKGGKDSDTGELRAPTAEEDQALTSGRQKTRETVLLLRADGSATAILGDEFMQDTVAVKRPDGSIATFDVPHGTTLPAAAPAAETK